MRGRGKGEAKVFKGRYKRFLEDLKELEGDFGVIVRGASGGIRKRKVKVVCMFVSKRGFCSELGHTYRIPADEKCKTIMR